MELYVMRYVVAVAETGQFSLAAQRCHVGQPALSQQIARLERELGLRLFRRTPRGAAPTQAGEEFVRRARALLQESEALQADMALYAGLHRGTLNIGIITSLQCIDFGGMLSEFCRRYPDVSVNIAQEGTYRLLQWLTQRRVDLAFVNRPVGALPSGVRFTPLGRDCYSLAVPAGHPLAARDAVSLQELKDARFIFHDAGQVASQLCLAACRRAGFTPHIVCRCGSPTTGLYMVRGGLGVAFLPSEEFSTHAVDGVVQVRLRQRIEKQVGLACRSGADAALRDAAVDFFTGWKKEDAGYAKG